MRCSNGRKLGLGVPTTRAPSIPFSSRTDNIKTGGRGSGLGDRGSGLGDRGSGIGGRVSGVGGGSHGIVQKNVVFSFIQPFLSSS